MESQEVAGRYLELKARDDRAALGRCFLGLGTPQPSLGTALFLEILSDDMGSLCPQLSNDFPFE